MVKLRTFGEHLDVNNWAALTRCTEHGRLEIDNNHAYSYPASLAIAERE